MAAVPNRFFIEGTLSVHHRSHQRSGPKALVVPSIERLCLFENPSGHAGQVPMVLAGRKAHHPPKNDNREGREGHVLL
jgi:hypothetical protein